MSEDVRFLTNLEPGLLSDSQLKQLLENVSKNFSIAL